MGSKMRYITKLLNIRVIKSRRTRVVRREEMKNAHKNFGCRNLERKDHFGDISVYAFIRSQVKVQC